LREEKKLKKHFIVISFLLVLLSVGLSGCIDPLKINGSWVMHTWDFEGEPVPPDRNVVIESIFDNQHQELIYVIKDASDDTELFRGRQVGTTIEGTKLPEESPLTISIIYVDSTTYMYSDMPLFESLNPYTFTR
jgi:hypothetical protein